MGMMSQWSWFGPSYTSSPSFVGFHELGHLLQPQSVQPGRFDENFASLLSTEAIGKIFGPRVGLFNKGMHNIDFFAYLDGKRKESTTQFILNYITKTSGFSIHNDFFRLWNESDPSSMRNNLKRLGFNIDESIAVIYSNLTRQNLGWLFRLAGVQVSDARIDQGLKLVGTEVELDSDLNKDGKVNIMDIAIVANAYGSKQGDPNWNQIADVDDNEQINILDISMVAKDFGKTA
jgi:hypothetical protein